MPDLAIYSGGRAPIARSVPYDHDAERSALCSVFSDSSYLADLVEVVGAADFHHEALAGIYSAMIDLARSGSDPGDLVLIHERMNRDLRSYDASSVLAAVLDAPGAGRNSRHYAEIVARLAHARRLIVAAENVASTISACWDRSPQEAQDLAEQSIRDAGGLVIGTHAPVLGDLVEGYIARLTDPPEDDQIPTGITALDNLTSGGLGRGWVVPILASPGQGKTALAVGLASAAARHGYGAAFYSLEMTHNEVIDRFVSHYRGGTSVSAVDAARHVSEWPVYIEDFASVGADRPTIERIRLDARRVAGKLSRRDARLAIVVVDRLALVEHSLSGSHNTEQQLSHVCTSLKRLAVELDVCVLLLCQPTLDARRRTASSKPGVQPTRLALSDSKGTGAIQAVGDLALLPYRPRWQENEDDIGAEIGVGKFRHGCPVDIVAVKWSRDRLAFVDYQPRW